MDLATKTKQMFPAGHLERISPNKVRLEFTEAESAEIELAAGEIFIRCTCPALRDDFWMDSFRKEGRRYDDPPYYNVVMKAEHYHL